MFITPSFKKSLIVEQFQGYYLKYNNQINACALIGQSAVGHCAGKPTEKSRIFRIII